MRKIVTVMAKAVPRNMQPSLFFESQEVGQRARWRLLKKFQVYLSTFKMKISTLILKKKQLEAQKDIPNRKRPFQYTHLTELIQLSLSNY